MADSLEELAAKVEQLIGQAEPAAQALSDLSAQLAQHQSTLASLERLTRAVAGKVLGVSGGN